MPGVRRQRFWAAPPKKGNCNNPADWLHSPVTCQKDKNQVVVHEVYKVDKELSDELGRGGFQICFGRVSAADSKGEFRHDLYGVWLNHLYLRCHVGVGYIADGKGPNVVTVLENTMQLGLVLLSNSDISAASFLGSRISDPELYELCTGGRDDQCDVGKIDNTLVIKAK
jgi:hypothetical protein